jgi:hypothetical protein
MKQQTREEVRLYLAEWLWLLADATWTDIWRTARTLGKETYEQIRAYAMDRLDGQVPAF